MPEGWSLTQPCVPRETKPPLDEAIGTLGKGQHAVFSLEQLTGLGMTAAAVRKRTARCRLYRLYLGVYSLVPPSLLTREGRWMAAVLALGPGAALSHRDAAVLQGLIRSEHIKIEATVAGSARRRPPGIKVHRSKTLTSKDITLVQNIPCTTVARTLLDLADVVDQRRLERAFDQAEIEQVLDMRALDDQLRRNAARPAARRVRRVLDEHYIGSTPTESHIEEGFLALCRRARLPRPEVQQWLSLPDGGPPMRVDFLWREQRVVVETDGDKYHGTRQARRRDARKDQRLIVHGFKPIRTGWRQIFRQPEELAATIRAVLWL